MAKSTLLKVEGLEVSFGNPSSSVVHGVSFELKSGEILALVGESGSGKSITCSALAGLLPPGGHITSGRCEHVPSGELWARADSDFRAPLGRGLSLVFQDPMSSLNPSMRVGWQVAESIIVHQGASKSEARMAATRLLDEVEIPAPAEAFDKYPHELSGGQKQRIMIALALAAKPEVLIADEPTTALDATVQKSILALLAKLQKERGMGVLFITHDLDVVGAIADRVLVMKKGAIVEAGEVAAVLENPQHPYTQALLNARNLARFEDAGFSPDVLIDAREVTKTYGDFTAIDGVSLSICKGERIGLIGESGSGKSTLGRMLIGMLAPTSGAIAFDGIPVDPNHRASMDALRKRAQLVFQDPYSALNPKLTVGSALREVLQHNGASHSDAASGAVRLLEEVGLQASDAEKYPGEFSGGQRQRIVIARALAVEPEFLVLDESVAHWMSKSNGTS
jgi:ABC-type glutathione transport system ATPase component